MKLNILFLVCIICLIQYSTQIEFKCKSETSVLCKLNNGTNACCPMQDGTCCENGDFCCPKDFKCDLSKQKCIKDNFYIPFHVRLEEPVQVLDGDDKLCPDNLTYCKDKETCCLFTDNKYGCCIFENAVCCDDKLHCCPKNYKCNPQEGKCDRKYFGEVLSIDWAEKTPGRPAKVEDVPCPGGSASCPDGNTCCQLSSGQWGCCPLVNAVCCSDHLHCCPNGYKCDTKGGRCIQGDISIPFYLKTEAKSIEQEVGESKVEDVPCPGGSASCPDGNTCCQLSSGQWGCCPLVNAVCCSDHLHCCPNGYKCDTKGGRCIQGDISIPFYLKTEAKVIEKVEDVPCPGGSASCPDGNTCCQLSSGQWGCCPLVNAVCCSDHLHCCPNGYKCDTKGGRCIQGDIAIPFYLKTEAKQIEQEVEEPKVEDVPCPGGSSSCPDGNTCCQLSSGQWGCCPLVNAVCCSDHLHCCPNGYKCDTKGGRCIQGDISIPFYLKSEAKEIPKVEDVPCPGGSSSCPDGNTCCQLSSGQWGCCPLVNAVCCSDHLHCCPNGYKCDTKGGRCIQGDISIPFYLKTEAKQIEQEVEEPKVEDVPCPGGSASCPDGNTCCQLSSGQWGCCPLVNAVCCSDHLHCCPNGYKCDTKGGRCIQGDISIPFYLKTEAKVIPKVEDVPCPGGSASCPDGNTCCQLSSGQWGCCPLVNAVCCSDHLHCCPNGYKCDTKGGRCIQGDIAIPFYLKTEAKPIEQVEEPKVEDVPCPGGSASCPDGNTCCQLSSGQWGCCPLVNAVCCSDHLHCCPNGYKCDTKGGRCIQGDIAIPFYLKTEAKQIEQEVEEPKVEDVPCPGGSSSCPDGNTCCQLSSGQWGCCPLENAVCCSDHLHCWLYMCGKKCKKIDDDSHHDLFPIRGHSSGYGSVPCPDGTFCPTGFTCCQLADGQWGCCPLENAVCCSDHLHCCPNGYVCDLKDGCCVQKDVSIPLYAKVPSIKADSEQKNAYNVVCPDEESECPNGFTCCQLSNGQWGCCPLENAVCCSDHLHCCPNGYVCDVKNGRCVISDFKQNTTNPVKKHHLMVVEGPSSSYGSVPCRDGSFCRTGSTCCQLDDGSYGCCPYTNAVCCSDHLHCCPENTVCNLKSQCCDSQDSPGKQVPWSQKLTQRQLIQENENLNVAVSALVCDLKTSCPPMSTCCLMIHGEYGCCPYDQAVCCGTHCCPKNSKCGKNIGECIEENNESNIDNSQELDQDHFDSSIDDSSENIQKNYLTELNWHTVEILARPVNGIKTPFSAPNSVCPGGEVQCTNGTCCQIQADSSYACCPYEKGTCCGAHGYCCPAGYDCDPKLEACTLRGDDLSMTEQNWHNVEVITNEKLNDMCPGGDVPCTNGTCCQRQSDSSYQCCPYQNGTCCGVHGFCCPDDYDCDPKLEACIYKDDLSKSKPMLSDIESIQCVKNSNKFNCPNTYSCCPTNNDAFECCPIPKSVCCENSSFCCPENFKCELNNMNKTVCIYDDIILDAVRKIPSF